MFDNAQSKGSVNPKFVEFINSGDHLTSQEVGGISPGRIHTIGGFASLPGSGLV